MPVEILIYILIVALMSLTSGWALLWVIIAGAIVNRIYICNQRKERKQNADIRKF